MDVIGLPFEGLLRELLRDLGASADGLEREGYTLGNFGFFVVTLVIALVFGLVGYRLKLPAGVMVGAMVGVILFNVLTGKAYFYTDLKVVLQIMSGAMIGSRIHKRDLLEAKKIVWPAVILMVGMIAFNLSSGMLVYLISPLDAATSLFATAPGGMTDMAIISADLGANPAYVALLQLVRILIIIICMPPILKQIILKKHVRQEQSIDSVAPVLVLKDVSVQPDHARVEFDFVRRPGLVWLLLCAIVGGLLLWALGVMAGAMIGAMIGSAIYSVRAGAVQYPNSLKLGLQIMAGAFIGIGLDRENLVQLPELLLPIGILLVAILASVFVVGWIMHKLTGLELSTCLLASTPGGISEMSLLSEELGSDTPKIAILQTIRLFTVILLFPGMLRFVTGILG